MRLLPLLSAASAVTLWASSASAVVVLGNGTGALLGNDLTDRGNDGNELIYNPPVTLGGFDGVFFASNEAGFSGGSLGGGEFAFNVFDNLVGSGDAKWCCGATPGTSGVGDEAPQIVGVNLNANRLLTHFTVTSSNDTPGRDPRIWTMEGSNDGILWDVIFSQNDASASLWGTDASSRNRVLLFTQGVDYPVQTQTYQQFRMVTTQTGLGTGAFFALNEIELFAPEPSRALLLGLGLAGMFLRRRR
ncbi:MAG: PEP-CTERM sorting domain-containing protein [Verrucomicrobiales bacterium]